MSELTKKIKIIANHTDNYLKFFFKKQSRHSYLLQPMKYGLFSGGKKIRSAIIMFTGKIFNIEPKKLIIISSAIECIHSYSLIHDDLPSMDDDDLRRGKLSTHKKYGEATAILAGNSLLTLGFEILSNKELNLDKNVKVDLINALSICSGHSGIAGGQYLDLSFEKKTIPRKKVLEMQNKKTGQLFGFCCEVSGIVKKKNKHLRNQLKNLGLDIGLLFQIADDLIDFKGNSKLAGKRTNKDKIKGKATLIDLIGFNKTLDFAKNLKDNINNKIKKFGNKSKDLSDTVKFILEREF